MTKTRWWPTGVLVLLALWLNLTANGCGQDSARANDQNPAKEDKRTPVMVQVVQPEAVRDVLIIPGATEPHLDVTLSSDKEGRVEWIGPKEGDRVKKGDLIAKIDVSAAKAELDNARAAAALAQGQFERRRKLHDTRIISQEELDQSRTELSVRQGAVRQSLVMFDNGFLKAPADGVVDRLLVDQGEFVARGAPVLNLVDVSQVKITVGVPEMDVKYLKPGLPVPLRVDALGEQVFWGTLDSLAFKADAATKTFRAVVRVPNPDELIRPGMVSRVALLRRDIPEALVSPLHALVDKGGERLVFVEKEGVARARMVQLGVLDGDRIQVTAGLEPGDRLIVSGQNDVEDGTKVVVQ